MTIQRKASEWFFPLVVYNNACYVDYELGTEKVNFFLSPDEYFNTDCKLNVCYCQACHEARGEKRYAVSGDPPCRYALPLGWCQFALR